MANMLLAVIEDNNLIMFDNKSYREDLIKTMKMLDLFNGLCSAICFLLGSFQLIMTLSANIKDSMWELGVLRSMGCTRGQINRVMVYELASNTLSAITLGYGSGICVSMLSIAQFHITIELPLTIRLPYQTMIVVGAAALISLVMGTHYGTKILYQRSIANILKGK